MNKLSFIYNINNNNERNQFQRTGNFENQNYLVNQ